MYEWDEAKRRETLRKHGVDFAIVERFDWEHSIADEDKTALDVHIDWTDLGGALRSRVDAAVERPCASDQLAPREQNRKETL